DIQHPSCRLRIFALGSHLRVAIFLAADVPIPPTTAPLTVHFAFPLAASLLVFCSGGSLCRYAPLLRNRLASALDLLTQARLGGTRRDPRSLRCRSVRILRLGPAHVRERPQPLVPRSEERRVGKECRSRWSPY